MKQQLVDTINIVDQKSLSENVTSPATKRLFKIIEEAIQLDTANSEIFHTIVAKLLYICKRSRLDLDHTVDFFV